ncbi:tetratricopeptide repeat protein [Microbacterium sp. P04]|uniref:tetratricopeptide repeat protein n=1 Tax=Microbacterium sp. P04 TaxID=3366947 RepID=UPI003747572B
MKARSGVALMAVLLLLYIGLAGQRAWVLITTGDPVAIALGCALIVLPVIAVWALGRELWFGVRAQSLGEKLEAQGELPADSVAVRPSGRVLRDDADAVFPGYRAAVEQHPEDWRSWYRLGLAYDAAGDRRRARSAIRTAISREAASRRGGDRSGGGPARG